jgi:transcriptional regulator with PAS, ATPase and Fis domain
MALLTAKGEIVRRELPMGIIVRPRPDLVRPLRTVERETVESALILCEGNRGLAAKRLGIAYRTLMRWVEDFRQENAYQ